VPSHSGADTISLVSDSLERAVRFMVCQHLAPVPTFIYCKKIMTNNLHVLRNWSAVLSTSYSTRADSGQKHEDLDTYNTGALLRTRPRMNNPDAGTATKATRRNGQLMSCEPCRRSKQRCDHEMPHCMRCRKRGPAAEAKCHYHPAPMTRGARSVTPRLSARESRASVTSNPTSANHTQ
jgi:hypothetical protein